MNLGLLTYFVQCDVGDDRREVTTEMGRALAERFGVPFFESSAKSGINVEEAFFELVSRDVLLSGSPVFDSTSLTRYVSRSEKCVRAAVILKPVWPSQKWCGRV